MGGEIWRKERKICRKGSGLDWENKILRKEKLCEESDGKLRSI